MSTLIGAHFLFNAQLHIYYFRKWVMIKKVRKMS